MAIGETQTLANPGADVAEDVKVSLSTFSEMVGFPVDFIKKELLIDGEELTMEDLRKSMLTYLENKNEYLKD